MTVDETMNAMATSIREKFMANLHRYEPFSIETFSWGNSIVVDRHGINRTWYFTGTIFIFDDEEGRTRLLEDIQSYTDKRI